ncbi:hypothetical protein Tco_1174192 [Tanacetum coccineum]
MMSMAWGDGDGGVDGVAVDCDGIPKSLTMYLNLWSYKVVRHRYLNPMIQPEPKGSTQGYPLVSVEVLRFDTSAENPVKEILLKLNLPDHRILKDGGEDFRYSDTVRPSQSDEVLKLKNIKKDASLKLFKLTNQERLCLVDDLKMLKITYSHTSQAKGTSSSLKSMITTPFSQENGKEKEVYEHKNEDLHDSPSVSQGTTSKAVVQPDLTNLPEKSRKQSYVSDRKDCWNLVAMELCFLVVVNE